MAQPKLRLSYPASIPFTKRVSFLLAVSWVLGFCGLFAWNFISQAKGRQCYNFGSNEYSDSDCQATSLEFARNYYTQPVVQNVSAPGSIGTFPWSPLAFGNGSNGVLDYSILTLNWTGSPLQCVMYNQDLLLDLWSDNSVVTSCYYCGSSLRVLCTTVDALRTQVPDTSVVSYSSILDGFNQLSSYAHEIMTGAVAGATVGSVRIRTHRLVPGLASGVLPQLVEDSFEVMLGTSLGPVPIHANNSNSNVAQVASYANQLAQIVEQATERDLEPASGSSSDQQRTLQVSYLCQKCDKQYKPTLEIIALLMNGIFAILTPAFSWAVRFAEWIFGGDGSALPSGGNHGGSGSSTVNGVSGLPYKPSPSPPASPGLSSPGGWMPPASPMMSQNQHSFPSSQPGYFAAPGSPAPGYGPAAPHFNMPSPHHVP